MVIAALILGLAGSLHCAGMCGPIALSLGTTHGSAARFWISRITYNIGRTITYIVLGTIFALMGIGAQFFHVQQWFSIALGTVLLIAALIQWGLIPFPSKGNIGMKTGSFVRKKIAPILKQTSLPSMLSIGMLNGLLPCGWLYMALFQAGTSTTIIDAIIFMAVFGLGTIPSMLAISASGRWAGTKFRNAGNWLAPFASLVVGAMLVIRGMGLGIPYFSPKMDASPDGKVKVECHHHAAAAAESK